MVDALQKLSGVVLVCWEHKALVKDILPLLPLEGNSPPVPTKWNDDRFDVVLRFDRAAACGKQNWTAVPASGPFIDQEAAASVWADIVHKTRGVCE